MVEEMIKHQKFVKINFKPFFFLVEACFENLKKKQKKKC